jgi:hypothetical protein
MSIQLVILALSSKRIASRISCVSLMSLTPLELRLLPGGTDYMRFDERCNEDRLGAGHRHSFDFSGGWRYFMGWHLRCPVRFDAWMAAVVMAA